MKWRYGTLPDMLAAANGDNGILLLDKKEPLSLAYRELYAEASALAGKLQARGIQQGDHIIVVLPTGASFASVWWAVQLVGAVPCAEKIRRDVMVAENRAIDETNTVSVVDCGVAVEGTDIFIVNEQGWGCGEGEIGRIWLSGPSIMHAYLNEETPRTGGWFDTGDIGYLRDGHLFVLGRHRELIIINGQNYQNYHPIDFERAAEAVAGVRVGGVVAFGVYNPAVAGEELHVICEVADVDAEDVCEQVKVEIGRYTGIPPVRVTLVLPRRLPRTTSGKLQRNKVKASYLQ